MSFAAAQFSHPPAGSAGTGDASQATLQRALDLLEADEVIVDGVLHVYRRGTTTDLLPPKTIEGSTCSDNVAVRQ